MPRGRWKRRGYHQRGYKLDGHQTSEDLCPYCYSFGCDPMSMSQKFRQKIEKRLRMKLCPCCGEPIAHCKCRSSGKIAEGQHTIRTHNNKKRRKAMQMIQAKERAYQFWSKHTELSDIFGETVYDEIAHAMYRHNCPKFSWNMANRLLRNANIDPSLVEAAWM